MEIDLSSNGEAADLGHDEWRRWFMHAGWVLTQTEVLGDGSQRSGSSRCFTCKVCGATLTTTWGMDALHAHRNWHLDREEEPPA